MHPSILLYGLLCAVVCFIINSLLLSTIPGTIMFLLEGALYAGSIALGMRKSGIVLSRRSATEFIVFSETAYLGCIVAFGYMSQVIRYSENFVITLLSLCAPGITTVFFLCLCGMYAVPTRTHIRKLFLAAVALSPLIYPGIVMGLLLLAGTHEVDMHSSHKDSVFAIHFNADNARLFFMFFSVQCVTTFTVSVLYRKSKGEAPVAIVQDESLFTSGRKNRRSNIAHIVRTSAVVFTVVVVGVFLWRLAMSPVLVRLFPTRYLMHSYSRVTVLNPFRRENFHRAVYRVFAEARVGLLKNDSERLGQLVEASQPDMNSLMIMDIQQEMCYTVGDNGIVQQWREYRVFVRYTAMSNDWKPGRSMTGILWFSEPGLTYRGCFF